jgi:putative membrane protein
MFKPVAISAAAFAFSLALSLPALAQHNGVPKFAQNSGTSQSNGTSQTSASGQSSLNSQEKSFLDQAAEANNSEIRAGLLAQAQAQNPEVKAFGRLMVFDHTEVGNEAGGLAEHLGVSLPTGVSQQAQQTMSELKKEQGASFDRTYMQAQVKDHKQVIDEFKKEASSAGNSEVGQFAKLTIPLLEQHLALAETIDNTLGQKQAQASQGQTQ